MPNDDKWVISSSGRHIFVSFIIDIRHMFVSFSVAEIVSKPGFLAKIHYGNEINETKFVHQKHR